ncbi:hypothetical protein ACWA7J_17090 [Leptothrix sp. BB-4]
MPSDDKCHHPQVLAGRGYAKVRAARHLVLRVRDPGTTDGPKVLRAIRNLTDRQGPLCEPADALDPPVSLTNRDGAIDLGFTLDGLRRLGVRAEWLERAAGRSEAFRQGAAARAARVGDIGASAPERWEAWATSRQADLVISLHGRDAGRLDALLTRIRALPGFNAAFVELACLTANSLRLKGARDDDDTPGPEHFGFLDGISRPMFFARPHGEAGLGHHPHRVALGELLLGHVNDFGANPWDFRDLRLQGPEIPPDAPDPNQEPNRSLAEASDFFRGGSFCALRKMRQDVAVFNAQVDAAARRLRALPVYAEAMGRELDADNALRALHGLPMRDVVEVARQFIRAQFCGRWTGGQPMQRQDGWFEPRAKLGRGADAAEAEARRCPQRDAAAPHRACPAFGSHIRRMNPRDDAVVPPRRRVVLRRGLPYGERNADDVGLVGLFFCASLEDQFEHLLGAWAQHNPLGPDNAGTARDPLIGQHADAGAALEIWLPDGSRMSASFDRPSVTTRGTLYLLYPARHGLDVICGGAR